MEMIRSRVKTLGLQCQELLADNISPVASLRDRFVDMKSFDSIDSRPEQQMA